MRSPDTLDALDGLVRLSNRVGQDLALVQPGGGNSSIKVEVPDSTGNPIRTLLVKGSGTDMRTIGRAGFSQLSLERLGALRGLEVIGTVSRVELDSHLRAAQNGMCEPKPSWRVSILTTRCASFGSPPSSLTVSTSRATE